MGEHAGHHPQHERIACAGATGPDEITRRARQLEISVEYRPGVEELSSRRKSRSRVLYTSLRLLG